MKIPKEMVAKIERILDFIDPAPLTPEQVVTLEYAKADAIRDAIEEEAGEWVEWNRDECFYRIRVDGSELQSYYRTGPYQKENAGAFQDAYRKGREVALEQVQELVSGITDAQKFTRCVEGITRMPEWVWLGLVDLAKKVKERSDV